MKKQSPINIRECLILMIFLVTPLFIQAQEPTEKKSGKVLVNLLVDGSTCSLDYLLGVQPRFSLDYDLPQVQNVSYPDRKFTDGFYIDNDLNYNN